MLAQVRQQPSGEVDDYAQAGQLRWQLHLRGRVAYGEWRKATLPVDSFEATMGHGFSTTPGLKISEIRKITEREGLGALGQGMEPRRRPEIAPTSQHISEGTQENATRLRYSADASNTTLLTSTLPGSA